MGQRLARHFVFRLAGDAIMFVMMVVMRGFRRFGRFRIGFAVAHRGFIFIQITEADPIGLAQNQRYLFHDHIGEFQTEPRGRIAGNILQADSQLDHGPFEGLDLRCR